MNSLAGTSLILIGGGGHAKVLVDCVKAQGGSIAGYVDPRQSEWLDAMHIPHLEESDIGVSPDLIMGYVGLDCASLEGRYRQMMRYKEQGAAFPAIIHPSAVVSPNAKLDEGVQVLPGAVINAYAELAAGAVINSSSVVEHDVKLGTGVHIAPGAVVLGGAKIAEFCYIGGGAVVVQNSEVLPSSFIKALSLRNQWV